MEVLAGEDNFDVEHREGGCIFRFDIRKVYWCSKLSGERDRLLNVIKKGEVLCDAFCGIGPLAIRAAKAGVKVICNDLNPECFKCLNENIKVNKISKLNIHSFNMDAREFIKECIRNNIFKQNNDSNSLENLKIDHIYMNLPKDALEFLDVFIGLFNGLNNNIYNIENLPIIHVYGFSNDHDPKKDLLKRAANAFKIENIDAKYLVDLVNIRDVSNKKHMYCLSLKIPLEVAFK